MQQWACEFFSGTVAEWLTVIVTAGTGVALAFIAYQANSLSKQIQKNNADEKNRRARTFGHMIVVEVGSAQSAYYNIRSGLELEVDNQRIPDLDELRRHHRSLDFQFLPHVSLSTGDIHSLPEEFAVHLMRGMSGVENARRNMQIIFDSPSTVMDNLLTPRGADGVDGVCEILKNAEVSFYLSFVSLWKFLYGDTERPQWKYPVDANVPEELRNTPGLIHEARIVR